MKKTPTCTFVISSASLLTLRVSLTQWNFRILLFDKQYHKIDLACLTKGRINWSKSDINSALANETLQKFKTYTCMK